MTPTWISIEEAMHATGWTERHLRRSHVESREAKERSRNGKPLREIKVASLPAAAQAKLHKKFSVRACPTASPADEHGGAVAPAGVPHPAQSVLFGSRSNMDALPIATPGVAALRVVAPRVAVPSNSGNALAQQRLDAIAPLFEYRKREAYFTEQGITLTSIVQQIAKTHGVHEQTVWRWDTQFRSDGIPALANKTRRDAGRSRWASQNEDAARFVAHLYLNERQAAMTCFHALSLQADLFKLADVPSYETVRAFLGNPNEISPALRMLAREGKRKYQETCSVYLKRDYSNVRANQVWVSDHCIHDVWVQNDCFGARDRKPIRLQLTAIIDFLSRMPVGYSWCENGSSRSISTSMRHAVQKYGACEVFYCDNGKDFQKVAKGAAAAGTDPATAALLRDLQTLQEQGTMARLGIAALHCLKYHPQSKHVERFFGTLHQQFDKQWPTYTGPDAREVPDTTQVLFARHKKLLSEGRVHLSEMPLASEFILACTAWIENDYAHQPHSGQAMDGCSPWQVFTSRGWNGRSQHMTPDILTALLPEVATRKVREGAVQIGDTRFIAADIAASAAMEHWNTRSVTVAFDPNDDIAVAHDEHGRLIAYLVRETPVGFYPLLTGAAQEEAKARVADSMQTRRAHLRSHRESLEGLAKHHAKSGARTPLEITRQRAALPAAVGDHITDRPHREDLAPRRMQSEDIADMIVAMSGGE